MIVVTGAAGFIGSALVARLNEGKYNDLVLVDDFARADKARNLAGKTFTAKVPREQFHEWLDANQMRVQAVVHLGARTDTSEQSVALFDELNVRYTQRLFAQCAKYQLPLVYASSAATYGRGEHGFGDAHEGLSQLDPQNPYGRSKHEIDQWIVAQTEQPFFWAGLKFFNVYGPNEYHKGRMASVIFHAFHQIKATGKLKLFRSHRPDYADGGQLRDFIYVKDVTEVIFWLLTERPASAIYNLGTGQARAFEDLGRGVFSTIGRAAEIEFIDIPLDIRDSYQYYTQADMSKLRQAGYTAPFTSLEQGIGEYVAEYLQTDRIW